MLPSIVTISFFLTNWGNDRGKLSFCTFWLIHEQDQRELDLNFCCQKIRASILKTVLDLSFLVEQYAIPQLSLIFYHVFQESSLQNAPITCNTSCQAASFVIFKFWELCLFDSFFSFLAQKLLTLTTIYVWMLLDQHDKQMRREGAHYRRW